MVVFASGTFHTKRMPLEAGSRGQPIFYISVYICLLFLEGLAYFLCRTHLKWIFPRIKLLTHRDRKDLWPSSSLHPGVTLWLCSILWAEYIIWVWCYISIWYCHKKILRSRHWRSLLCLWENSGHNSKVHKVIVSCLNDESCIALNQEQDKIQQLI